MNWLKGFSLFDAIMEVLMGALVILIVLWLAGPWAIGVIKMLADTWNAAFP